MANSILDSHYPTTSNAILTSQGWPDGSSTNSVLASHDASYPNPGGGGFTAVLNAGTGVMTIIDPSNGLGVKTTYTPTWLASWNGVTDGTLATNAAVGLDRYDTGRPQPTITTATAGIGGNPLLLHHPIPDGLAEGYSIHPQKFIAATTEILMSHWMRVSCTAPWSGVFQIKNHRMGYGQSDAPSNYANANPRVGLIKYHHANDLSLPTIAEDQAPSYWATQSGGVSTDDIYNQVNNISGVAYNTWIYVETYCKWNDVGSVNGVITNSINNQLYLSSIDEGTPFEVRLSAGDTIRNVQYIPGIQSVDTGSPYTNPDFDIWLSRPFVDSGSQCRRQVFLGNASTLSACTGKFMLAATGWAAGAITASEGKDRPSGYNYLYITDDSGAVTSNGGAGFAFSTV